MSIELIVAKFGGWSVETPENTDKSIDIISHDDSRRVVIVSGPKGLTDLYLQAAKERILRKSTLETYRKIMSKWEELCSRLELEGSLGSIRVDFEQILGSYDGPHDLDNTKAKKFIDNVARLGEFYEAKYIFVPGLNKRGIKAIFLDPNGMIYGTDSPGDASILPESADKLRQKIIVGGLTEEHVVVIPGFYCYTKDGDVVTLPRGGSDTTGSFAANALDAAVYENYTNDTIRRASPDAVKDALQLEKITYNEALELAYMGFGILRDEAIIPCMEKLIPIYVIDTLQPDRRTKIIAYRNPDGHDITGVAYKPGFGSINIRKVLRTRQEDPSLAPYVLHTEFGVGGIGEFPIEQIMTSVSNISFLIPGDKFTDERVHNLKRHLVDYFKLHESNIDVRHNVSLIAVVGQYMRDSVGINYRAAGALALSGISTSHLIQGGSEISILYGVQESTTEPIKAKAGVGAIYNEFFVKPIFVKFLRGE